MTFLPIVERELRIAARKRATYWLRCGVAGSAIVITLFAFMSMNSHMSGPMVAKQIFGLVSAITMVFCLFAGMFLTADCLSSEKREGTIGLLFLTDLHGYDVVLGKLAANSLHACYGLVAMLPILAIPLLAGGVTVGEFWRVVVVLLASLFFSLGIGMFVSSASRETRQALALSALLVIFISGLLPTLYQLIWLLTTVRVSAPLLWPSAGNALTWAYDGYYNYRTGHLEFWGSILTIVGLGFAGLVVAGFLLPRAWQEKSQSSRKAGPVSLWRRMRFGAKRRREALRALLTSNPFHWLTARDRLSPVSFWIVAVVLGPVWLLLGYSVWHMQGGWRWMLPFQSMILVTFGINLVFKFLVASEASRRLNDDHRSGALELLLVTPLTVRKVIAGQKKALRRMFLAPILFIEFLFVGDWILFSFLTGNNRGNDEIYILILGNMAVLLTDFAALGWAGMWTGLRSRYHHRAVLLTLLRILVFPWLLFFILGFGGFFYARNSDLLFPVWFGLCALNDFIWGRLAHVQLRKEFRNVASVGTSRKRGPKRAVAAAEFSSA